MKEVKQVSSFFNPTGPTPFNLKHEIMEWVRIIFIAAVIAFFLNRFIITSSQVPSSSMENTIMAGNRTINSRLTYQFGENPQRGGTAIFSHKTGPGRDKTRLVKRVVGPPGETMDVKDSHVHINQSEIPSEETYPPEEIQSSIYHFEVPDGCYLMLGNNRSRSFDARFQKDPYVPEENVLAKVLFRYHPGAGKIQ